MARARTRLVLLLAALVAACSSASRDASGGAGQGGAGGGASGAEAGQGGAGIGAAGSLAAAGGGASAGSGASGSGGESGSGAAGGAGGAAGSGADFALPPSNAGLDYQLGGAYQPPSGVMIVSRDRHEQPAAGLYNICYVNGFQIQPDEEDFWVNQHPDLILRDQSGDPVVDQDWDEMLIDVGSAEKRTAIAAIAGDWIQGCANAGFDAVEIDNLDSYSRSGGRLHEDDAVAMMSAFSAAAHAAGLAIAQKNSAELVARRDELGTDFVVAEECNRYDECDVYTGAYGDHVLVIEYRTADFTKGCSNHPGLSIVLRDLELVTPGNPAYVYDGC